MGQGDHPSRARWLGRSVNEASGRRHRGMAGSNPLLGRCGWSTESRRGRTEKLRDKKSEKISENPLTSGSRSAIIGAQGEGRQSPQRVRPMRVRKTIPDEPTARRKSEMVRYTVWRALGSERVQMSRQHLRGSETGRDSSREDHPLHR